MFKIEKITLNESMASLVGFAKKSKTVESGFEATCRGIQRGKVSFVLIDASLGDSSFNKITAFAKRYGAALYVVQKKSHRLDLVKVSGNKILGIHEGSLANGFMNKLEQENEWL